MQSPYSYPQHDALIAAFEAEIQEQATALGEGVAADFPDYKHRAGIVRGLQIAIDLADAVRRSFVE